MDPQNDASPAANDTPGQPGAYRIHHDPSSDDSVIETVVRSVAAIMDLEPTAVESPHDQLDTDALNSLFRPRSNGRPRNDGYVKFTLEECVVVVYASDLIEIVPLGPTIGRPPPGTAPGE